MNLRVLEYVIAVAEHGGVTRAAEELRVSEPALSKAIQQLEEEWATLVAEGRGQAGRRGALGRGATRTRRGLSAATSCEIS